MSKKINSQVIIEQIKQLASLNDNIEVVWLYGSRARNLASDRSDYDLAIAFKHYIEDPIERRLQPELLALQWQRSLSVDISIIDIKQASLPMAYTIVQDNTVLYGKHSYRNMAEEQVIMSKWEIDYLHHRKQYA